MSGTDSFADRARQPSSSAAFCALTAAGTSTNPSAVRKGVRPQRAAVHFSQCGIGRFR